MFGNPWSSSGLSHSLQQWWQLCCQAGVNCRGDDSLRRGEVIGDASASAWDGIIWYVVMYFIIFTYFPYIYIYTYMYIICITSIYTVKMKVRMPPRIPNIPPPQLECGPRTAKNPSVRMPPHPGFKFFCFWRTLCTNPSLRMPPHYEYHQLLECS